MSGAIDLVLPWVDGSDEHWQAVKRETCKLPAGDDRVNRYRDWDNLRYLFRGIDTFLPFVRTVHFVTFGHLPAWLNTEAPRLHIVRHEDYIPSEYLPTFSSHPIELNFYRIEGLAEQFIYANDDTFFLQPLSPDFFFKNGLPCDACLETAHQFRDGGIDHIVGNDLAAINAHFDKATVRKTQRKKWFSPAYGKAVLQNLYMTPFAHFAGFDDPHLPCGYLKSTCEAVWEAENARLSETCRHRVRSNEDVNQWLFRYWQFATGAFTPVSPRRGKFFSIGKDDAAIRDTLLARSTPMVCLSDDDPSLDFETEKRFLADLFDRIFPEPSAFERS